jgi:N utilization substance protein A
VETNDETKEAVLKVAEDQLSLAIGKRGQNVRLAAKLTSWKIDIVGVNKEGEDLEKDGRVKPAETTKDESASAKATADKEAVEEPKADEDKKEAEKIEE